MYAVYYMKLWNVICKLQYYYTYIQQKCKWGTKATETKNKKQQKPKAKSQVKPKPKSQPKVTKANESQKPSAKWSQSQKPKSQNPKAKAKSQKPNKWSFKWEICAPKCSKLANQRFLLQNAANSKGSCSRLENKKTKKQYIIYIYICNLKAALWAPTFWAVSFCHFSPWIYPSRKKIWLHLSLQHCISHRQTPRTKFPTQN